MQQPEVVQSDPQHGPFRGVKSKVAYGMNLDGTKDGPNPVTCGHESSRLIGIDNQLYRPSVEDASKHRPMAHLSIRFD